MDGDELASRGGQEPESWSARVSCSADVMKFLKRLENAGWKLEQRVGEYAEVICDCDEEHFSQVILWPAVPTVLEKMVRFLEKNTCLGSSKK